MTHCGCAVNRKFADGTPYALRRPRYTVAGVHSTQDADAFANEFPHIFMLGAMSLGSEASLVDFRESLKIAALLRVLLFGQNAATANTILASIDDAFARHGIDSALQTFCDDNDLCH